MREFNCRGGFLHRRFKGLPFLICGFLGAMISTSLMAQSDSDFFKAQDDFKLEVIDWTKANAPENSEAVEAFYNHFQSLGLHRELNERLEMVGIQSLKVVGVKQCPQCEEILLFAEQELKKHSGQGLSRPAVIQNIFNWVFTRFETEVLYAKTPQEAMWKQPYGRFLYNYLINLMAFTFNMERISSLESAQRILFRSHFTSLQCGFLRSVHLGRGDIHWLLEIAGDRRFVELKPCLIGYVMPRLDAIQRVDLVERVWIKANQGEKRDLQGQLKFFLKKLTVLTPLEQPLVLWMLGQRDPRLMEVVLESLNSLKLYDFPQVVHKMFLAGRESQLDLVKRFGSHLCSPQNIQTLFELIQDGGEGHLSIIAEHVLPDTSCHKFSEILKTYWRKAGLHSNLAFARFVLTEVMEPKPLIQMWMSSLPFRQSWVSSVVIAIFEDFRSQEWIEELQLILRRMASVDPDEARALFKNLKSIRYWDGKNGPLTALDGIETMSMEVFLKISKEQRACQLTLTKTTH